MGSNPPRSKRARGTISVSWACRDLGTMKRRIVWLVVLAAIAAGAWFGYAWYSGRSGASTGSYRMASVARQDIVSTISATGTLVPEDVVDVGAQVNGLIASFGLDTDGKPIDYRSTVKSDQVLAKVDDAIYAAQVSADEASLTQANAAVRVAEASRDQARARLEQSQRDWARAQKLGESQALSQADYDASKSSYEQATASLAVTEAQIGQARAQVAIAEAALQRSRRNLYYCTIKSPVDGVIIDRRVEIGQTVVSSLNAPSLFLIAKDLSKMLVLVQVNEADIGHVKAGDKVTFGVDAFGGQRFRGEVRKVRLNATMTQNVVTYTVEIVTSNEDLTLLPYLTANVRFITSQRPQVLAVPNAALRWSPPNAPAEPAAATPGARAGSDAGAARSAEATPTPGRAPREGGGRANGREAGSGSPTGPGNRPRTAAKTAGRVWVLREGVPTPINVVTGLSDGTYTEITSDELNEGDEVIAGQVSAAAASAGTTNPFAPQPFRPGGGGGRPGGSGR